MLAHVAYAFFKIALTGHRCRARSSRYCGSRKEGIPGVSQFDCAADRTVGVPTDQQRRMGFLQGSGKNTTTACFVSCTFEAELVCGPGGLHGFDIFVLDLVAPLKVHAQRVVLPLHIARTQAERDTPAG